MKSIVPWVNLLRRTSEQRFLHANCMYVQESRYLSQVLFRCSLACLSPPFRDQSSIWSASSCMHMIAILLDHTSDHAGRWSIYPLLIISAPLILNLANQSLMYRHAVFSHNKTPTLLLMHNIFYYNNKINKTERDIMMINSLSLTIKGLGIGIWFILPLYTNYVNTKCSNLRANLRCN